MRKLIGIEGSSYVGKTTVANELLGMGYGVVPEYDTFGPFPVADGSVAGYKSIVNELLDRERSRKEYILTDRLNFSDRTPVSLVTFEEMRILHAEDDEKKRVYEDVRNYALSRIIELSERGQIVLPSGIAVLRMVNRPEFQKRVERRGVTAVRELALFATQLHIAQKSFDHATSLLGTPEAVLVDVDVKCPSAVALELVNFARHVYNENSYDDTT